MIVDTFNIFTTSFGTKFGARTTTLACSIPVVAFLFLTIGHPHPGAKPSHAGFISDYVYRDAGKGKLPLVWQEGADKQGTNP
jgi:hypothetical protein